MKSCFDMASTDSDDAWTLSPEIEQNSCHADSDDLCPFSLRFEQHLRAVSQRETYFDATALQDVILDSGADASALPMRFAHVGDDCPSANTCYVDAQGAPLTIESTRIANVQFGDVTFRFIVSDVTCPLLALGSVLRSGWDLVHFDGVPYLMKGDKHIEVIYRNNSLCSRGQISVLSRHEPNQCIPAVRAVQLGMSLRSLVPGWNRINPHLYAIKTKRPEHVDTTLAPSDELMWLRTTLVFREGSGWEVNEFCEEIADLRDDLTSEIYFPETIVEVITLAHKYATQAQHLGSSWMTQVSANLQVLILHVPRKMTSSVMRPVCLKMTQNQLFLKPLLTGMRVRMKQLSLMV